MAKYGLPTFPIYDGMILGHRQPDEVEWLLEHGVVQTDLYRYNKIVKVSASEYRLFFQKDSRYDYGEEDLGGAHSLQELLRQAKVDISSWYWYGK